MPGTLPEPAARTYLNGKFAQITKAVSDRDWDAAAGVIAQMRTDGYPEAADHAFDGVVEAKKIADTLAAEQAEAGPAT